MKNNNKSIIIKSLSGAKVELYINNKIKTIRKSAMGSKRGKLFDELRWYQTINNEAKCIFPKISSFYVDNNIVGFYMPFYYDGNTLENIYEKNSFNLSIFISLFDSLVSKLYLPTLQNDVLGRKLFMENFIKDKLFVRLSAVDSFNFFSNININGKELRSLYFLLEALIKSNIFIKISEGTQLCRTHGDLTLKNILINSRKNKEFIFIDVNPKKIMNNYLSDPAEDISRMLIYIYPILPIKKGVIYWDKINGGYVLNESTEVRRYEKNAKKILNSYCINLLMSKIYPNKKELMMRIKIFRIIHVLTISMSRIIDGDIKTGTGLYLWGHRALANFINKNNL